jgi:hypothetical protein
MTDKEKAQRLLDRASRVLTGHETSVLREIAKGGDPSEWRIGAETFRQLCKEHAAYLQ